MAQRRKSAKELQQEREIKGLREAIERRGVVVRREKLSRGAAFRVRSGDCLLTGQTHVFLDRRLPAPQQISLLVDYLLERNLELESEDLENLSPSTKKLLSAKVPASQSV